MPVLLEKVVCFKPGLVHCGWPWANSWAAATQPRRKKQWADYTNVSHSMTNKLACIKQLVISLGSGLPIQSKYIIINIDY